MSGLRVEKVVTSGTFSLDDGTWDVDNNVWLVGDDDEVLVVDAAHRAQPILDAVGTRRVIAIACTHAHDDHVTVAPELSAATQAPVRLHPDDDVLWNLTFPGRSHAPLADGDVLTVAGEPVHVLHTPGHSPGAVCFYAPALSSVFTGDTLFQGGPGATGRSFSSFDTILESIQRRLLTLPADTTVHPGHGPDTTIGAEAGDVQAWIERGH